MHLLLNKWQFSSRRFRRSRCWLDFCYRCLRSFHDRNVLAECGAGVMFGVSTLIFVAILAINIYYYDRKNAPDLC